MIARGVPIRGGVSGRPAFGVFVLVLGLVAWAIGLRQERVRAKRIGTPREAAALSDLAPVALGTFLIGISGLVVDLLFPLTSRPVWVRCDAPPARVAEWQTRRTQNPLSARACGFDSHLGHRHKSCSAASRMGKRPPVDAQHARPLERRVGVGRRGGDLITDFAPR